MPTTAKLVSAITFAIIGWLTANAYVPSLGDGVSVGHFRELTALIGVFVGWRVLGNNVGPGYSDAAGTGLRTSAALVFFALLSFSIYQMVMLSFQRIYDTPIDAVLGVFSLMMKNGKMMFTPAVLGTLIIGGIFGGLLAERTSRRWR